jgi:LPS-assembly protein
MRFPAPVLGSPAPAIGLLTLVPMALGSSVFAQQPEIPAEFRNPFNTITVRADTQRKVGDLYSLRGHVDIAYHEAQLSADEATYNEASGEVEATGRVSLSDPRTYLEADRATYNLTSGAATLMNAHGYVHPRPRVRASIPTGNAFFVRAREIDRLDERTYVLHEGRITSCENECRGWSLEVRSARVQVDDKAVSYGDVFRFLGVPIFYAPVLEHSTQRIPRQTGFLIPSLGNSSQKGRIIGDAFYWAMSPSADLLLGIDDYSLRGIATIGRFRATPSDTSQLVVNYFEVNDHGSGPLRSQRASGENIRATGTADDLGYGFRGVINVDYINTLAFRLTWSGNFNEAVSSEARQTAFASKSFDGYSLNVYADRYEDFLSSQQVPNNAIIIRQTPSLSFAGLDHEAGDSPFYFSFDASAAGVGREQPGFATPTLTERVDFHPALAVRVPELDGFHFTPVLSVEGTRYGTSFLGTQHPLTRMLGEFSFDLRPPSLERVFKRRMHHYRLKHVIEPDIQYNLVRPTNAQQINDIVRFDETDILAQTNEIEYSLKTTLYGRPDVPDDQPDKPQARELVSLSVVQKYYFDPTFGGVLRAGNFWQPTLDLTGFAFAVGRRLSPVVTVLKVAPFSNFDTELRADISPVGGVLNAGITSSVRRGQFGVDITDFFVDRMQALGLAVPVVAVSAVPAQVSSNLFNTRITYGKTEQKGFSGAFGVNYNFTEGVANGIVGQVTYNFNCFGIDVGYNRFNLGPLRDENQFRIAISLSNVGAFGNLRTRDRLYQ